MKQLTPEQISKDIRKQNRGLSISPAISKIIEVINDENSSVADLANSIQGDPGLAATVLRVANSAYYQRRNEARSINDAIMTLGELNVRVIALTASILQPRDLEETSGFNSVEFVANSVTVGSIARILATKISGVKPEEALMAGLLHDIGQLFLVVTYPRQYADVIRLCDDGVDILEAENKVFGVDHQQVGASLSENWRLPTVYSACIRTHHSSSATDERLVLTLRLAVALSGDSHLSYRRHLKRDILSVAELSAQLDVPQDELPGIVSQAAGESMELAGRFDLQIGDSDELIRRVNRKLAHYLFALENLLRESETQHQRRLEEERLRVSAESRAETVTRLSHHINNAAASILGKSDVLLEILPQMELGDKQGFIEKELKSIAQSVEKIRTALDEMGEIVPAESLTIERFINETPAITATPVKSHSN